MPVSIASTTTVLWQSSLTRSTCFCPFHPHGDGLRVEPHLDTVARKRVRQELRRVAFLLRQEHRYLLNDRGLRAKTAKRLRELAAEWSAADDEQTPRKLVRSNTFSLVRKPASARPGIAAVSGLAPVAIIALLKRSFAPSSAKVSEPVNRPRRKKRRPPPQPAAGLNRCG